MLQGFHTDPWRYESISTIKLQKLIAAWGLRCKVNANELRRDELIFRLITRAKAILHLPPSARNEEMLCERPNVLISIASLPSYPSNASRASAESLLKNAIQHLENEVWIEPSNITKYPPILYQRTATSDIPLTTRDDLLKFLMQQ